MESLTPPLDVSDKVRRSGVVDEVLVDQLAPVTERKAKEPAYDERTIELVRSAMDIEDQGPRTLQEMYNKHNADTRVDRVEVNISKDSANVLYMSELLIGHQDSDVGYFGKVVEQVKSLPEDSKPDIIVMSGLVQGDFKIREKTRRVTLVPELNNMHAQFAEGRKVLGSLMETGVPVIYNMSNDDRAIAEGYTIDVIRKMNKVAGSKESMAYHQIEQTKQDVKWQKHLNFQIDTVFPYCLRSGRPLRTAEEMKDITDGEINTDEYFMLYETKKRMDRGEEPNPDYAKWLELDNLKDTDELIITDDVDMVINTNDKTYNDMVRHNMQFSNAPMYQRHTETALQMMGQLAANGKETPDSVVTEHMQELTGVSADSAWSISTGAFTQPRQSLERKGRQSQAPGDVSKRLLSTRRRIPEPNAVAHERTDDGRHIITIFNEKLNDKTDSIADRMTIAELCDLQTGSITARPDLLAKYIDYIRTKAIGERPTALFFGGDMIHGRNYSDFPRESQRTGLMSIDSQQEFNRELFKGAFNDVKKEELEALQRVIVQIGNHEWNSGTEKWHGSSFANDMQSVFERMYARAGYSDKEIAERVKFHDALITPKGEFVKSFTGIEYFGKNQDVGVLIQHFLLARGGKGGGGNSPVYQGHDFATGAGDLVKNIDILMAGHWHHPQFAMFGDKLNVVGGSMAGLSGYELWRGYRPTMAGTMIHMGGGLPVQIEFVSEEALHKHKITTGEFSEENLKAEKFKTDRNFNTYKHGIMMPDSFPKSALQKAIEKKMRAASQSANTLAEFK